MFFLSSRNVSAQLSQYEGNADVTWTGQASGLAGNYVGALDIETLMKSSFVTRASSFAIGNVTQRTVARASDTATVNSSFTFVGRSDIEGNFSGAISAQDLLVYSRTSGAWLISRETWNFLSYSVQYPVGGYSCSGPSCPKYVQDMAISEDGNFLAAGAYQGSGYGAVYLVSLQKQGQGVLWRSPIDTTIWSVAISGNGSYVAAGGFQHPGDKHGRGEVYLFNREGMLLWNFPAGSEPRMVKVAIAANGSRVAADYGSGIIYLDEQGKVLWNQTFPRGGMSSDFAMSSDAKFVAYTDENITLQNSSTSRGWGVFYLDSHGRQLWSHIEEHVGVSFVQVSSDGSEVVASSRMVYNGSIYYFNGRTGVLLWDYYFTWESGFAPTSSLAMSPEGAYVSFGGPAAGVFFFDSGGRVLWTRSVGGPGAPVSVFRNDSLALMFGCCNSEVQLIDYNGTTVATFYLNASTSVVVGSPEGPEWASAEGTISPNGGCATLHVYNDPAELPSSMLCW